MNSIQRAQACGQEIWLDYIQRGMLKSGELKRLADIGITGLTANPTILDKAIAGSTDYDDELAVLARAGKLPEEIYETVVVADIRAAADLFRPTYDSTDGAWGFASLELSPLIAYDTQRTVEEGRRLFKVLDRPNVMVKVPATPECIPAIRRLIGEGINVNVTLIFSLDVYDEVAAAYVNGLEDLVFVGRESHRVASVASFFLSRIDTAVDALLEERIAKGGRQLEGLLGTPAVASAKLAYRSFKEVFYGQRFATLKAKGARPQRPLWASTSTKNPRYSDVKYVEPLIGRDTINTLPLATINAFLDHGRAEDQIENSVDESARDLDRLRSAGIDLDQVTARLLAEGVSSFVKSFDDLMSSITGKAKAA